MLELVCAGRDVRLLSDETCLLRVEMADDLDVACDALVDAMQALKLRFWQRRLRVSLGNAWVSPMLIGPVTGLRSWREAVSLAEAQAQQASPDEAAYRAVLEAWPGSSPALALATPLQFIDKLQAAIRRAKFRVTSIRPWWADAVPVDGESLGAQIFAARDGDGLAVLVADSVQWRWASCYRPVPDAVAEQALLARLCVGHAVSLADVARVEWSSGALQPVAPIVGGST
ncbi:MAG TPA: hypothetical protein VLA61_21335 [Ideonella sp.]|uniref:hypothetical protein n=1 Tax=Ideonella sp. TaxID=1929293 RepID=UPI002CD4EF34|nr:hypothetical protein [Ideonella sp.]HSI50818.1 hypothetical protein [Ideonella sp.]